MANTVHIIIIYTFCLKLHKDVVYDKYRLAFSNGALSIRDFAKVMKTVFPKSVTGYTQSICIVNFFSEPRIELRNVIGME